jgi:hypothetical protein
MMTKESSIYLLADPVSGEICYVGKTTQRPIVRFRRHLTDKDKNNRMSWIRSLALRGLRPCLVVVQRVPSATAAEAERYWIAYFRACGCPLTNMTDGGDGVLGLSPSEESKESRRRALLGHAVSDETRARISAALRGKKLTPEHRAKLSTMRTGKKRSAEFCQRMKEIKRGTRPCQVAMEGTIRARTGKPLSLATRLKLSAIRKGHVVTEETRSRISVAQRGRTGTPHTEASKRKLSSAMKGRRLISAPGEKRVYVRAGEVENGRLAQ